ncbi:hypothetical protein E2562_028269 [Oryza meyeriana var. granulata]|uniref:DUF834 domain-containing protein n=1 Tax=Oryza meyeriana var. granulata TaxID=110450 RepID=A0A6G1E3B3_9ORYZ|nr:hypothetical protein E2562_028269 [Oryza meyeriana var. granulata]
MARRAMGIGRRRPRREGWLEDEVAAEIYSRGGGGVLTGGPWDNGVGSSVGPAVCRVWWRTAEKAGTTRGVGGVHGAWAVGQDMGGRGVRGPGGGKGMRRRRAQAGVARTVAAAGGIRDLCPRRGYSKATRHGRAWGRQS